MTASEANEQWLLLRGLGRESAHWGDFPVLLSAAFKGAGVHTLDLPGSGVRSHETVPWSMQKMALRVRQDLPTPWFESHNKRYILAMSLGAMVAIEWLSLWPDDFDAAILINASVGGLSMPWERLRPACWLELCRTVLERDPLQRETRIHKMTCNRAATSALLEQRAQIYGMRPLRRISLLRQLAAASRYRLPPTALLPPVLLLASSQDRLVNPGCSSALQQALGAKLLAHDWANHDLPYDDPEWIIEQIRRWRRSAA